MLNLTHTLARRCHHSAHAVTGRVHHLPARFIGFHARSTRGEISRRLRDFNHHFAAHCQRTDAEFSTLAKSLRELYAIARSLSDLVIERLGSVRNALHESRIAGPDGLAGAALQDVRRGLADAAAELTLLETIGGELQALHSDIGSVERVGLSVRTAVFGFAVESARTDECQHFASFAADLRGLGDRIMVVAGAIDSHIGATRAAQQKEWRDLSTSYSHLCDLAEQLKTAASATADEAQRMLDRVLHGLEQAGECMRQITHRTEEAVFYLQFGDIVRQKTEHIADALDEIADALDGPASQSEFCARATVADRVIAIQIGQLELVRSEVESVQRKLLESFRALAEETSQMRGTLHQWHTLPNGPQNKSDSLTAFTSALRRMEKLHRQGHELRIQARRSTRNAIKASHGLAGHVNSVKQLNFDLHLQALNAIIKAAALGGQGATLSVLSMHVDSLYCDSQSVVARIIAILESVLGRASANAEDRDLVEATVRSERLHGGMRNIEFASKECCTTFTSANKLIEQQQNALEATHVLLGSLAEQDSAIQKQILELTAFRKMLSPWMKEQGASAARIEISNDRYTMQSERDIHLQATQAINAMAVSAVNQELFSSAALPQTQKENSEHPNTLVVPSAAGPASGMGDNVELF